LARPLRGPNTARRVRLLQYVQRALSGDDDPVPGSEAVSPAPTPKATMEREQAPFRWRIKSSKKDGASAPPLRCAALRRRAVAAAQA
jgi:hypothetical protein